MSSLHLEKRGLLATLPNLDTAWNDLHIFDATAFSQEIEKIIVRHWEPHPLPQQYRDQIPLLIPVYEKKYRALLKRYFDYREEVRQIRESLPDDLR